MKRILIISLILISCSKSTDLIKKDNGSLFVFSLPKTTAATRITRKQANIFPHVSIAAVGDIMFGNHTIEYLEKNGNSYPFDSTCSVLRSAGLTLGNLEGPFSESGVKFDKKFNFKIPPKYADGLITAGFDVVTLANNHILDYGITGLKSTFAALDSIGLAYCGAGLNLTAANQPAVIEKNGCRIALFGYSMTYPDEFWAADSSAGTCFPYDNLMESNIHNADTTADFVIVNIHWGAESSNYPKQYQKKIARKAIDAGADLVLGHHPHVLQGLEIYKNRLIAYSLGNFTFSSYSRKATESMILKIFLTANGLLLARAIPLSVDNDIVAFQPRILHGKKAAKVISNLQKFSQPLNSEKILDDDGYILGEMNF